MGAGNGRTFALSSGPAAPECAVPRPARILVVLPAYNEEANIASLLRRIFETLTDDQVGFSVIVVDDGSSDRTREILEETQREMPLIVQRHERNQGLGATLRDGRGIEERQPHLRGGAHEPLTRAELEEKFARNARAGGWPQARLADALALARTLFDGAVDLDAWRG